MPGPLYTPDTALEMAKRFVRNERLGDSEVWTRIRQSASDMIWSAAPWRWTIGVLGPVSLAPGTGAYGVTFPPDFDYIVEAYVSDGKTWRTLKPVPVLAASDFQGEPDRVAADTANNLIRVAPVPATPGWRLFAYYKKLPPIITDGSVPGALVMPDTWAWVYEAAVLYFAYLYADDVRAGSAQIQATANGQAVQFTGQRGLVEAAIALMREREPLPLLVPRIAPGGDR